MNGLRGWGGRAWLLGVYAFLYVPILCLVVFSFTAGEITTQFDGFSLRWYAALAHDAELHRGCCCRCASARWRRAPGGAGRGGSGGAGALRRVFGSRFFAGMMTAPMVMPEVVVGLSLVLLFTHPALPLLGGRGVLAIWVAHATLCAGYVAVLVASRLKEMDRALEEAALDLGCPPLKVFL